MKIFHSEYQKNYSTYTFGYATYALLEENDSLSDLYSAGFLPYAGTSEYASQKSIQEIFYLCRSLRIDLNAFSTNSENRRIEKKARPLNIEVTVRPKKDFIADENFRKFCQDYADERFQGGHMSDQRWDYVLRRACGTHIFTYKTQNNVLGYVLVGVDAKAVHYWFSFFDTNLLNQLPVGKYLMLSVITWAKENGKSYAYLGTCYGEKALYKVRDFKGAEFYDGAKWNEDITLLKSWCKQDQSSMISDRYKM